ncbi:Uncharacterised protein [Corynebacterium kutscheri]|uniref:Uncharacterized protein n=1 Tax=Corynebacterium kutscheri TaxID=35755 RepID=A0A0F6R1U8_9CORY|nr:hypothetical protein [Corynebacterium kutscheri]AKE42080.1 hypothetical protein UL82_09715 [Corynebacterium kutscheri]VEH10422.1 Uncharacterised protein [Corynebacterium kutscheri]VEH81934.1 Uncharacterised protein [Corynebacterium kutscheri]
MRYKNLFYFGVSALVIAFVLSFFYQWQVASAFLFFAAASFTFVFWNQTKGRYHSGKYAKTNLIVDTIEIWAGILFITIFHNWGAGALLVIPISMFTSSFKNPAI